MDITADLKSLAHGQILLADDFTLFEAMAATELFDKKIDLKLGLADADTPIKMLKEGKIKKGSELSQQEIIGLFDLVFKKWMIYLNGNALAQSVYTLVYQYDDSLWDNQIISALFESLNSIGAIIYKIVKEAPFLREEDYNPSMFSFRMKRLSIKDLLNNILNPLDNQINVKKKSKQLTTGDAISMRIKLLKGFAQLVETCSLQYDQDTHQQLEQHIEFIRKRLDTVIETQNLGVDMKNYTSDNINKHILSMISMRKIVNMEDPYQFFKRMLDQFEAILDLSKERNLFSITHKINVIQYDYPKNILARAYLETSIFKYETFQFFKQHSWTGILLNTLNKMYNINFDKIQEHKEYIDTLVPITYDYTIKQLRAKFRKMRDFHKIYQHISILVHQSNVIDQEFHKTKNHLMIFSYEIGLQMMITQLQLGFDLELYSEVDYTFIYFYLEYLITILDRNRSNYVLQLPQAVSAQLQNKKKRINPLMDQLYSEIPYYKGFQSFYKGYSRLLYTLMQKEYIRQVPQFENRYSNRLKIFENCFFFKPIPFKEYEQKMNTLTTFEESLNYCSQCLQEAQQHFSSVKDYKFLQQELIDQAKEMVKVCVITSVGTMKLKMNPQQKVKFIKTSIPYIMQLELYN